MRVVVKPRTNEEAHKRLLASREKALDSHKKNHSHLGDKKKTNWKKIILWTLGIILAITIWSLLDVAGYFIQLMQMNPTVWSYYQAISAQIEGRTLLGLFYASFFGSLFFISLPVEVIFLYYLGLNYYVVQIITVVMIGNILGMLFNYGFGRLIGERIVKYFMKENYGKFRKKIEKAGALLILIGNIIPFPIEPLAVFLGAVKFRFSSFIMWTGIGKFIKFIILAFGYTYVLKYAGPYLDGVSIEAFIEAIKSIFIFW